MGDFMSNKYSVIDERKWKRTLHCQIFRNYVEPCYCVTFEAEITRFREFTKKENLSFTLSMVYAVCKCANEIEELRYRFLGDKIILYEKIDTAFTYLNEETELFKVVKVPFIDNINEYVRLATETARNQSEYFTGPLGIDVFQCSPMPWIKYIHVSHTNAGKNNFGTPLFDWGKFYDKEGRIFIPISIQVHHSFVDGIHIGKFVDSLQNYFSSF